MSLSPTENELTFAVKTLRAENPILGIVKLHALLRSTHPEWAVSEKRFRKILPKVDPESLPHAEKVFPSSQVIDGLNTKQWSSKIKVEGFGKPKGKGLVATESIVSGEVIWKEDPFIIAPEWDIFDLQTSSRACAFCTTPLTSSSLVTSCPASSPSLHCPARFCNRLCLSRSSKTHPLLCLAQNPASVPLLSFARKTRWMACHAVAHCIARILLTNEAEKDARNADWRFLQALAVLGMEERFKDAGLTDAEPDRETWKMAHKLTVQAFRKPSTQLEQKKLSRLLRTPLPEDITTDLFEYDAYLRNLGRMSLNLEAHGGLYVLHSHLNHVCTPNVSVRHFDTEKALARITLIAKNDIAPGEELVITYVDPDLPLHARRRELASWGFGICTCMRCKKEEDEVPLQEGAIYAQGGVDPDLEKELLAGLGVM